MPDLPRVNENRVVLPPKPPLGDPSAAIVPDDLVQKIFRPKNSVELNPHVMRRPPIEMNPQSPMPRQQAVKLNQVGLYELQVLLEPAAPDVGIALTLSRRNAPLPRRKWWIDIDQVTTTGW